MTENQGYRILVCMKIVVTGATGLLGRAVYRQLKEKSSFMVVGAGFSRSKAPLVTLNLRNNDDLRSFLLEEQPDCIVHCAAERRPDVSEAEPEASEQLNVEVTAHLAEHAQKNGICMIYISTDYVFDGTNPPYYPDSLPNPLNFYGRTKLAGERAVQDTVSDFTILRVPILYGGEQYPLESSISTVAASLNKNRGGRFDDTAIRYPTYTGDVARILEEIILMREAGNSFTGIYHFSGKDALTKYQMALMMAPYLHIDEVCISPDRTAGGSAKRPENSHLDTEKLKKRVNISPTSFSEAIKTGKLLWRNPSLKK